MAATLFKHDGCEDAGCHTAFIKYESTAEQIEALSDLSETCSQSIVHQCTNNGLTGTSWWLDRNNQKRQYWSGDYTVLNETGCACSLEGGQCNGDMFGRRVYIPNAGFISLLLLGKMQLRQLW